jgi:hypothetical protein
MRWPWFPPEDHINTGHLCSAASQSPTSSPTSKRVCSPPRAARQSLAAIPSSPCAEASVPLADGVPPGADACSADDLGDRCVPRCNTPPDPPPPRPYFSLRRSTQGSPSPSRKTERSASGVIIVFEATYPRPTHSRAYASPTALPQPSQGSLPARAGSPLAGRVSWASRARQTLATASPRTRWTTCEISWSHRRSSNPNRPAEPGRTILPTLRQLLRRWQGRNRRRPLAALRALLARHHHWRGDSQRPKEHHRETHAGIAQGLTQLNPGAGGSWSPQWASISVGAPARVGP